MAGSRFLFVGLFVAGFLAAGCAKRSPQASVASPSPHSESSALLETGRRYARQGQSVRAEQYFRAALEAGASQSEVVALLIETCVQSGRYGRALFHVRRELRRHPEDRELLRLSTSLNEALGHEHLAQRSAAQLGRQAGLGSEHLLFLAEFFERRGEFVRARSFYQSYLRLTPHEEQALGVPAILRRLVRQSKGETTAREREAQ